MLDWKFNEAWNEVNRLNEADSKGTNSKIEEFLVTDLIDFLEANIGKTVNLHKYAALLREKQKNGTITNAAFAKMAPVYVLQYIVNAFKTEAVAAKVLGGTHLSQNNHWTVTSTASIGEDGYALADVTVDDKEVEIKTFKNFSTVNFDASHNKPFVLAYIIGAGQENHWQMYFQTAAAKSNHAMDGYAPVAENAEAVALLTKIRDSKADPKLIKLIPVTGAGGPDRFTGYKVKIERLD